jgi:hypothetical protein
MVTATSRCGRATDAALSAIRHSGVGDSQTVRWFCPKRSLSGWSVRVVISKYLSYVEASETKCNPGTALS